MRGTKAKREAEWRTSQRQLGYLDALGGRNGMHSDQYYQRGYRAGQARKQLVDKGDVCRSSSSYIFDSPRCGRPAKADWLDAEFSGDWIPVCGIHGRVAERQGRTVKWR